jgi:hypothetical protein
MHPIERGDLVFVDRSVCVVLSVRRDVLGGSCVSSYRQHGQRFMFVHRCPARSEVLVACPAEGFLTWIDEAKCERVALD